MHEIHDLTRRDAEDGAMAYNFVAPERGQLYLLPPSFSEWLPEDHLTWFILT
ncbi:MAG: hypothetical protein ACYCS4_14170 [Acidimicrobiales bacterium]